MLWMLTIESGRLGKLAAHPVANFPVARAFERLDEDQFQAALSEMEGTWSKLLSEQQVKYSMNLPHINGGRKLENGRTTRLRRARRDAWSLWRFSLPSSPRPIFLTGYEGDQ